MPSRSASSLLPIPGSPRGGRSPPARERLVDPGAQLAELGRAPPPVADTSRAPAYVKLNIHLVVCRSTEVDSRPARVTYRRGRRRRCALAWLLHSRLVHDASDATLFGRGQRLAGSRPRRRAERKLPRALNGRQDTSCLSRVTDEDDQLLYVSLP